MDWQRGEYKSTKLAVPGRKKGHHFIETGQSASLSCPTEHPHGVENYFVRESLNNHSVNFAERAVLGCLLSSTDFLHMDNC